MRLRRADDLAARGCVGGLGLDGYSITWSAAVTMLWLGLVAQ
jgi:hypothetical protein